MIANTPAAVEFLAARIREVIATKRYNRQPWSRKRIADYISSSLDIDGTLSDTTLGRFLTPSHPQRPSDETVAMVAAFLLHHRYMARDELEWIEQAASIRCGLSLAAFFEVPRGRRQQEFLTDLSGHYVSVRVSDPFVLRTRLVLSHMAEIEALMATEVITLYRWSGIGRALSQARFKGGRAEIALEQAIRKFDLRNMMEQTSTGQTLAFVDLIAIFLKSSGDGMSSIIGVDEVVFGDEVIEGLHAKRNNGWKARGSGDLGLPDVPDAGGQPRGLVRALSNNPHFLRVDGAEKIEAGALPELPSEDGLRSFFDTVAERGDLTDSTAIQRFNAADSADDRLVVALEWGDIELFRQALAGGADPNVIPKGSEAPLVFELAKHGRLEWAKVLLDTGRCSLAKDSQNCPPSYYAGVLARQVAGVEGAEDLAQRYADLHGLLSAEESRQMKPRDLPRRDGP